MSFADNMEKRNKKSALDVIAGKDTDTDPHPVPQQPAPEVVKKVAYKPKLQKKKEKQSDTHSSRAYMIENELLAIIDDIVGDEWGGKNRFLNEAIKLAIYQEFPEYAHRIKASE